MCVAVEGYVLHPLEDDPTHHSPIQNSHHNTRSHRITEALMWEVGGVTWLREDFSSNDLALCFYSFLRYFLLIKAVGGTEGLIDAETSMWDMIRQRSITLQRILLWRLPRSKTSLKVPPCICQTIRFD